MIDIVRSEILSYWQHRRYLRVSERSSVGVPARCRRHMIVTQLKRMRGTMARRLQYRVVVFGLLLIGRCETPLQFSPRARVHVTGGVETTGQMDS